MERQYREDIQIIRSMNKLGVRDEFPNFIELLAQADNAWSPCLLKLTTLGLLLSIYLFL